MSTSPQISAKGYETRLITMISSRWLGLRDPEGNDMGLVVCEEVTAKWTWGGGGVVDDLILGVVLGH